MWAYIIGFLVVCILVYILIDYITGGLIFGKSSSNNETPQVDAAPSVDPTEVINTVLNPDATPTVSNSSNGNTGSGTAGGSGSAGSSGIFSPPTVDPSNPPTATPEVIKASSVTKITPLMTLSTQPVAYIGPNDNVAFGEAVNTKSNKIDYAECPSHVKQFFGNVGDGLYSIGVICDDGSKLGPWGSSDGKLATSPESQSGFKNAEIFSTTGYIGRFFGMGANKGTHGRNSVGHNMICKGDSRISGITGQYYDGSSIRRLGVKCKPIG